MISRATTAATSFQEILSALTRFRDWLPEDLVAELGL